MLTSDECTCTEGLESLREELEDIRAELEKNKRNLSPWYLPTSCKKIAELDPQSDSGYYWLATQHGGRAQVYCDYHLTSAQNPAHSCKQLAYRYPTAQSGHYWILNGSGAAVEGYCDLKRRCCGSTGGWMRVAHLDMTDPNHYCPEGFRLFPGPKRLCTRDANGTGCTSIHYSVHGVLYSHICGKVIGYQNEKPDGFIQYHNRRFTINEPYVDGISITHGRPTRRHIWTFAGVADETTANSARCPCTKTDAPFTGTIPPFVGSDYFCDTGSRNVAQNKLYYEDALWDGRGCGPTSSCCQFNSPPYFCKALPRATTDDIEVRLCEWFLERGYNEDIPIEAIELFVQ